MFDGDDATPSMGVSGCLLSVSTSAVPNDCKYGGRETERGRGREGEKGRGGIAAVFLLSHTKFEELQQSVEFKLG